MQNNLSDTLNLLMAQARINSSELARATGLPATTIKRMRNHEQCNPTISTLTPIAKFFAVTIHQLISGTSIQANTSINRIPLFTFADAEKIKQGLSSTLSMATEKSLSPGSYGLTLEQALDPFPRNAILVIDRARLPSSLDYVLVSKNTSNTLAIKRYVLEADQAYLLSLVPGVSTVPHTTDYDCLGVIVQYQCDLK